MNMDVFMRSLALLFAAFVASALGEIYNTRFEGVTWDNDNWVLSTTTLDQGHYQSRMSLANGYLGINVAAVGPFFEVDTPVDGDMISGWPLFSRRQTFATVSGFWDYQPTTNGTNFEWLNQYGGESVISGVPHWAGLTVEASNGQVLNASVDASQISNFTSSMNFKTGVLSWNYIWTPSNGSPLAVAYTMFVHKLNINQAAVQLSLTATNDGNVTVTDVLEGDCAVRTDFVDSGSDTNSSTIWTAVRPLGISNVTAYIYSTIAGDGISAPMPITNSPSIGANQSSVAQSVQVAMKAGTTTTITKYVGGASTDAFPDPQSVARSASSAAAESGFQKLLQSHQAEWAAILTQDSVDNYSFENGTLPTDPYIVEQQIISVTNPYHLLQNTIGSNAKAQAGNNSMLNVNSISVGGLGSDSYAGLIFWDADVWMAPGLLVAFPEDASAVADYRARLFSQAQKNIDMAYSSSQNETGKFTSGSAAVYPWTSGRFGNCTGTGPCFDYEYHINGDIGLDLFNYYVVTGDTATFRDKYFPVYDGIATFYSELVTLNQSTGTYGLTNATDPDEFANFVDNPGYTMALMKTHLSTANTFRTMFGQQVNALAANTSNNMNIPGNDATDIILEYSSMNGSISVKQADVVLIDDFLDYPNEFSLSDLDYYALKQSDTGPGMTYGVFSIVANAFSPSGCSSWTYGVYSSHPYVRAPWFQYSEQLVDDYTTNGGTHPAYPFLTGMGGANRVAIFGYLGLRLRLDALNVDPALPPQISNLDYRTFYWQGYAINATSNTTHTTLQRIPEKALTTANSTFSNASIPITIGSNSTTVAYQLPASGAAVIIPNRDIGSIKTWPGNIAQCVPATTETDFVPGQFPFAANDGALSTKWQPVAANVSSSMTVELGAGAQGQIVNGFRFDWAQAPPSGYSVAFSNSTGAGAQFVNATSTNSVAISIQYDAASASLIQSYTSNTTNVTLSQSVYAGRYAMLTIWGNQAAGDSGAGATVAEFAVIVGSNNTGDTNSGGGGGSQSSMASGLDLGFQSLFLMVVGFLSMSSLF
ncbi:alpha,alpha-trehalase ath1 [Gnomoniopsis smithogilvyi]|uniref:alpha,alpha-trehalase n=1 Tax=Gnomoniopsis smithogilvyi TaxID=1191159 RepID=A0A9W9CT96_9PEZI|nr:alpha,alpha-trehalase ath1 [Gnomoniopsis smithogilvyi]